MHLSAFIHIVIISAYIMPTLRQHFPGKMPVLRLRIGKKVIPLLIILYPAYCHTAVQIQKIPFIIDFLPAFHHLSVRVKIIPVPSDMPPAGKKLSARHPVNIRISFLIPSDFFPGTAYDLITFSSFTVRYISIVNGKVRRLGIFTIPRILFLFLLLHYSLYL